MNKTIKALTYYRESTMDGNSLYTCPTSVSLVLLAFQYSRRRYWFDRFKQREGVSSNKLIISYNAMGLISQWACDRHASLFNCNILYHRIFNNGYTFKQTSLLVMWTLIAKCRVRIKFSKYCNLLYAYLSPTATGLFGTITIFSDICSKIIMILLSCTLVITVFKFINIRYKILTENLKT